MRRSVALRALGFAVVWLPLSLLWLEPARAACDTSGATANCSGDVSGGVSFVNGAITSINVQDLTATIAPASPTAGIVLQQTGADAVTAGAAGSAAPALSVNTDGSVVVTAQGASNVPAPAISVSGTGGNGAAGSAAPDGDSNGGTGGTGGAGGAISIVNKGSLSSDNIRAAQTRAVEFNLTSELTDASTNLADANTEKDIRAFLQTSTDPDVEDVCGNAAFGGSGSPQHCNGTQAVSQGVRDAIITLAPNAYTLAFTTNNSFPFIDDDNSELDVEIRTDSVTTTYLSNDPLPEEMRGATGVSGVISAVSLGGNGANGGPGGSNSGSPEPQGGTGGTGGAGGSVSVTNDGSISSTGNFNSGILAISRGGNAGNGGDNSVGGGGSGLGGLGGIGGAGGTVTVSNTGTITTTGVDSTGITAQSIGGTGATGLGNGDSSGNNNGSAGGAGGQVTVTDSGSIRTQSYGAYGVFAQSLGGTGGDSDNNTGGTGGAAGHVTVTVSGSITTAGEFAHGVFASSTGGTGGLGGDGNGDGGDGGAAGNTSVTVSAGSVIQTAGDSAMAVYAQSKGGTGGVGASTSSLFWASAGGGGNGGLGGDVSVTNAGTLKTGGNFAFGLFAQSLGGSGGYGGQAAALVAQSGAGGSGAPAGDVTVDNSGTIATTGTSAFAIFAQSVAGGGGDAGSAGGLVALGGNGGSDAEALCIGDPTFCNNGGSVSVTNNGNLTTSGDSAFGIFAESVGGGGGNGGSSTGLVTIGGAGGAGGNGGLVTVLNDRSGRISVAGDSAYAIFAQSVGGGGGNGGDATSIGTGTEVAIGGEGGSGGFGSAVSVTNNGTLIADGDRSAGIYAQSVGGGGGNGGNASAEGLSALTIAIGGKGGDGGAGGTVIVTNNGSISVGGDRSNGVFAQSVGGGGGNGGSASTFGVAAVVQISVAVGGDGGGAGAGDSVRVDNAGSIVTTGNSSVGVFAQSVGGGGGNGGDASATSIAASVPGVPVTVSVSVAVGGKAGGGGDGGSVNVNNLAGGSIETFGIDAHAIQAQSVGGGGGNGGSATASSQVIKGKNGVAVSIGVGGKGGSGGIGGSVSVVNDSSIVTNGEGAIGIFAQSIGGGGGNGGDASVEATADEADKMSAGVAVSVGGSAGTGNIGGSVTVSNIGSILTTAESAYGIFAQSVGGGGGTGGSASSSTTAKISPSVSVGGTGGTGGDGGSVTITNDGSITTLGDKAVAVFVQSVGGGGGNGGDASGQAAASDNPDKKNYDIAVSVGGNGGLAGDGGTVLVTNNGTLSTAGVNAYGVFGQSVGGGGGTGGGASASGDDGSYSLSVSVGGKGGAAGDGGSVTINNAGSILTTGRLAYGIIGQSVGGGGGIGGDASSEASSGNDQTEKGAIALGVGGHGGAGGDGGLVTVSNNGGDIETAGYGAHGIFAESVGGGGGAGASGDAESSGKVNVGAGLGGGGGASGNGGTVQVTNAGTIMTLGDDAYGILAQSVGGGGGVGVGAGGSGNGNGSGLKSIGVSVGGGAGASGDGGSVTVSQTGNIQTVGVQSFGVFAQSVGGGGGVGGAGENNTGGQISVGGDGGNGGNGGAVTVNVTGNISTFGTGAHAIIAQSIGGGGGVGGDVNTQTENINLVVTTISTKAISIGVGATGTGGDAGNGGNIDVTSTGTITTYGQNAYGIFAQSIGGGGGLAGQNSGSTLIVKIGSSSGGSGSGGAISITHTGSIYALGADSHGIFAQSAGPNGGGNITISVSGGTVVGGSASGVGVYIDQGSTNTLNIGSTASISALSGNAIHATGGDDTVNNAGLVTGNLDLGGGVNAVNNNPGGILVTGTTVNLGNDSNVLSNGGTLDIGGTGSVVTTALTGTLTQSATGTLAADVRFDNAQASDLLTVSGTASLNGSIKPHNLYLMPNVSVTILRSSGGVTNNATPVNTPTITYGLDAASDPNALKLTIESVEFGAPSGLTGNQASLAQYFQNIYNAGGSAALAPAMGYLVNLDSAAYAQALDHLHPAPYLDQASVSVNAGFNFTNNLMSCHGFDGSYAAIREHECNWVRITGGVTNQSRTSNAIGYDDSTTRIQAGRQVRIAPDWFLGVAVGYERGHTTTDVDSTTDSDRFDGGFVIKHAIGPWLLAGALDVGYSALDTSRLINFPTAGLTASSNSSVWHLDGRLRASYLIEQGAFYLKPFVDTDLLYVNMPSFSESGAGPLDLQVESMSDTRFAVTPTLEFGATFPAGDGANVLRPFVSLGATWYSDDTWSVSSSLDGAPAGTDPFVTTTTTPRTVGNLSAGLDIFSAKKTGGLDVRLQYDGQFADHYQNQTGAVKFAVRF